MASPDEPGPSRMSGRASDRPPIPPLDAALGDLGRTLEALRAALAHRERPRAPEPEVAAHDDAVGGAMSIVEDVLSIPVSGLEPHELFTLATDRICRVLAADRVMFFVAQGNRLRPRSARGFRRDDLETISVEPGEGIIGRAWSLGRVLTASGHADDDPFVDRFPVKEAIAVPVRAEDGVAGVLFAGRRSEGRAFTPNDVLLLHVVADRVGGAFVQQALLDRCAASVGRLRELSSFAGAAPLGRELKDVLARAVEVACRLIGVRAAAVGVGVEDLELVAARGLPRGPDSWRSVSRRDGLTAELYGREEAVVCRDVQARRGVERSFLGEAGFHGCLLLPLNLRGLVLGVLYLADTDVRDFSPEEIEAARVLAAMIASAIENSRVHSLLAAGLETTRAAHGRQVEAENARTLADVAGGVAREFNQIFAVILGKSQLLLARAADEAVREGLGVIEEAAWRGADIVHRVGALAAPAESAGEAVDMRAVVQDAVALARTRWREESDAGRRIEITTDLEPVPTVRGDATTLREAVGHLVRNAFDAMPEGGRLALSLRARDGGVEVAVADTGDGVRDEVARRVFDAFFTTRAPARMGLGLTTVRSAVIRLGGRVSLAPGPGRGTTATIWLPAGATANAQDVASPAAEPMARTHEPTRATIESPMPAAEGAGRAVDPTAKPLEPITRAVDRTMPPAAPVTMAGAHEPPVTPREAAGPAEPIVVEPTARTSEPPVVAAPSAREVGLAPAPPTIAPEPKGSLSILVLEDEEPVRAMLVEALTGAGHRVHWATDGPAGLAMVERAHFDVVLTDLALPQRSGLAVARSVKRMSPHTPVILITGWGHLLDPTRLREHGVDLMLVKPFRPERAVAVVSDAVRLHTSA